MKVLVTGSAGFIGSELALKLLERGDEVVGLTLRFLELKQAQYDKLKQEIAELQKEAEANDSSPTL